MFKYEENKTTYTTESVNTTALGNWTFITKTVVVPANSKYLNLRVDNLGTGNVWFDDVMIRKTANTALVNLEVPNDTYKDRKLVIAYNTFKAPVTISEAGVDKLSFVYNDNNSRSVMFYGSLDDTKTARPNRKYYSADGTMEIKTTPSGTEFVTYLGGDGYSAPIVYKKTFDTAGNAQEQMLYLHRDYQGSIIAITNDTGVLLEKRQFDAWGAIVQVQDGNGNKLAGLTILDRGYTGHEHLQSVGLINMNGRLYDPKLHRFLQPDNFVQDPSNTQNYNRYGYVLNNPLRYSDPTGEFTWSDLFAAVAIVVGVVIVIASAGTLTPAAQYLIGAGAAHFLGTFAMYANNGYKDWDSASNYIGISSPTINIDASNWFGGGKSDKNGITQNDPAVTPKSDTDGNDDTNGNGGGQGNGGGKYDWWFFENQYFSAEAGLRAGTYIDLTPFKNVLGVRIGEYTESSYKADYYNYEGNLSHNENHYFEFGATVGGGFNYKYNIGEHRFESFSLSLFGFSAEYSKQSSYQHQFYIGLDTGFSIGIGIGGTTNVKGGWKWDW